VKGNPKGKNGKDGKGNDSKGKKGKIVKVKAKSNHVISSQSQKMDARTANSARSTTEC
jgi:hypothetical protein